MVIVEPTSGTTAIYGKVDTVSWFVAAPGSHTSGISCQLTYRLETLLLTLDNLGDQQSGMLLA